MAGAIKSRVSGSGCPVCANRMVLAGVNDLATINPELARQWHPTKNGDLTPSDVVPGTRRKVWWVCDKGHEWRAAVSARVNGSGCPVCTSKMIIPGENDLASQYPAVAAQWHPTKNGTLTPEQVAPASNKKVWWICDKGHEYQATIASRTQRGGGCPYCANTKVLPGFNDLATKYPHVAAEWHPTKNAPLTPDQVLPAVGAKFGGSAKMVTPGKPSSIRAPATKTAAAHSAQATPSANAAPATSAILPKTTNTNNTTNPSQRSDPREAV